MPALTSANPTLADWIKTRNPDGSEAVIANILAQSNPALDDFVMMEANDYHGHVMTVSTFLGDSYFRGYNEGVPRTKATTAQITEAIGNLEKNWICDADLAERSGDASSYRLSQLNLHTSGIKNTMAETQFYGSVANNRNAFNGLLTRVESTTDGNGSNLLLAGGTTADEQTSVVLVGWGDHKVYGIFPKGHSSAGLEHMAYDARPVTVSEDDETIDTSGATGVVPRVKEMIGYQDWMKWKMGIAVEDWQYLVRIGNVEVGHFDALTNSQAPGSYTSLIHQMIEAVDLLPDISSCRPAFYMNRRVRSGLSRLAMEKSAGVFGWREGVSQFGEPRGQEFTFMGIPIRVSDSLLNTEAVVS